MGNIETLQEIIDKGKRIVFFGGAGLSTASGIPDFRGDNGLFRRNVDVSSSEPSTRATAAPVRYSDDYRQKFGDLTPEMILSTSFFHLHPKHFFDFYREYMIHPEAQPNPAHEFIAKLEKTGRFRGIVTQNIDGLHRKAGNRLVYELHGSIHENYCMDCNRFYDLSKITSTDGIPRCDSCGGVIKPYVVLYGEAPDKYTCMGACREISNADVLIVAGTSLQTQPAASFIDYFRGKKLVVINKDETSADYRANLTLRGDVSDILSKISID